MKINKVFFISLTFLTVILFAVPLAAVASESRFFVGARDYFDRHCSRTRVSNSIAFDCYLFEQTQSVLNRISTIEQTAQTIAQQIANIQLIPGIKGDKGDQGAQGIQGLSGIDGMVGSIGPKGDKGDQGIQGPQGSAGTQLSNLVAQWRFEDTGNVIVDTGHAHDGTANGTVVVAGKFGNGRLFNGASDLITVPSVDSLMMKNQGAVTFWVKTTNSSGQGFIDMSDCNTPSQCGNQNAGFSVYEYSNNLSSAIGNGTLTNSFDKPRIDDGQFHFLTLRWNGNEVEFLVDGISLGATLQTFTPKSSGDVHIGYSGLANGAQGNGYFSGVLDEVSLYSRTLTNSEILELMRGETVN